MLLPCAGATNRLIAKRTDIRLDTYIDYNFYKFVKGVNKSVKNRF